MSMYMALARHRTIARAGAAHGGIGIVLGSGVTIEQARVGFESTVCGAVVGLWESVPLGRANGREVKVDP